MSRKPVRVTLCAECRVHGPWRFTDDGVCIGKHECAAPVADPQAERDAAIAATSDANPHALTAAVKIITDCARTHETFSANTCRIEMDIAQVPSPVRGAAFGQAVRDGIIRRDGYVPSTQLSTHGHPVAQWRSRIYRPGAA